MDDNSSVLFQLFCLPRFRSTHLFCSSIVQGVCKSYSNCASHNTHRSVPFTHVIFRPHRPHRGISSSVIGYHHYHRPEYCSSFSCIPHGNSYNRTRNRDEVAPFRTTTSHVPFFYGILGKCNALRTRPDFAIRFNMNYFPIDTLIYELIRKPFAF